VNITVILCKCNSWQEFREQLHSLTEKQKGDCFETLTKHFLQLHPEYVTLLSNVWRLEEVPPRIRKYLNLPQPDEGIDLIAETKDRQYWAIQCKYRTMKLPPSAVENLVLLQICLSIYADTLNWDLYVQTLTVSVIN